MGTQTDKERIRAYFSHSYRPEDKHRNLFFWEMFSDQGCYFTVDQKPYPEIPMDVTYLEWLMNRSDCFIAVIPKRYEKNSPDGCSPYQSFENGLAVRANKPRLIFAEDGLPEHLFLGSPDEICFFPPTRYKEQEPIFREKAHKLLEKARAKQNSIPQSRKPIAIITERRKGYTEDVFRSIRQAIKLSGYELGKIISPSQVLDKDWLFILDIEQYEILISETRWPYVSLDLFASAHQRSIPTIRVCHLEQEETEELIAQKMNLSKQEEEWVEDASGRISTLLRGYQLDSGMHPVIFWHNPAELAEEIASRLSKMAQSRNELLTLSDAKRYFLRIGRRSEKVFISNEKSANNLGRNLANHLFEEGIERFHYMDFDAIPIGTPNWVTAVKQAIDESKIFVMLINKDYLKSKWCMIELEYALAHNRDLRIHPYLVEDMDWPEQKLSLTQGKNLTLFPKVQWVELITKPIITYLESESNVSPLPIAKEEFQDVNIYYNDNFGRIGVFDKIENSQLANKSELEYQLKADLYDEIRKAGASYPMWENIISITSKELYDEIFLKNPDISRKYREILNAVDLNKKLVRFRFATDRDGFRIPYEWMKTSEKSLPLCLEHAVRRYLIGYANHRPKLGYLDRNTMRVLLVAANTGNIPDVENEIDALEKLFIEFGGLLKENVYKLYDTEATPEKIEKEITSGNYHILHFAGHGGHDEQEGSVIQVFASSAGQLAYLNAPKLREWVDKSNLRFVYMSSCLSASMSGTSEQSASQNRFRPTQDILQALVEAKVPEAIGFHWPIKDDDSLQMAVTFYEHFIRSFDSAIALLEARKKFADKDAQIWATPVLVQQA